MRGIERESEKKTFGKIVSKEEFFGGNRMEVLTVTNWELVPLSDVKSSGRNGKEKQTDGKR